MVRIKIYCEGLSEETFIKNILVLLLLKSKSILRQFLAMVFPSIVAYEKIFAIFAGKTLERLLQQCWIIMDFLQKL